MSQTFAKVVLFWITYRLILDCSWNPFSYLQFQSRSQFEIGSIAHNRLLIALFWLACLNRNTSGSISPSRIFVEEYLKSWINYDGFIGTGAIKVKRLGLAMLRQWVKVNVISFMDFNLRVYLVFFWLFFSFFFYHSQGSVAYRFSRRKRREKRPIWWEERGHRHIPEPELSGPMSVTNVPKFPTACCVRESRKRETGQRERREPAGISLASRRDCPGAIFGSSAAAIIEPFRTPVEKVREMYRKNITRKKKRKNEQGKGKWKKKVKKKEEEKERAAAR